MEVDKMIVIAVFKINSTLKIWHEECSICTLHSSLWEMIQNQIFKCSLQVSTCGKESNLISIYIGEIALIENSLVRRNDWKCDQMKKWSSLSTGVTKESKSSSTQVVYRSSHPEVLLEKGALKICSKFPGEHPCWSVIWIKMQINFIEITFRHGCSPVNLVHIFRATFSKNISRRLLCCITTNPFFRHIKDLNLSLYKMYSILDICEVFKILFIVTEYQDLCHHWSLCFKMLSLIRCIFRKRVRLAQ